MGAEGNGDGEAREKLARAVSDSHPGSREIQWEGHITRGLKLGNPAEVVASQTLSPF